jgi:hypothetical protein
VSLTTSWGNAKKNRQHRPRAELPVVDGLVDKQFRFQRIDKNKFDGWYRQAAYDIAKGIKIPKLATV